MKFQWTRWLIQLSAQQWPRCFSSRHPLCRVLYGNFPFYHFFTQTITVICPQGWDLIDLIIFTALSRTFLSETSFFFFLFFPANAWGCIQWLPHSLELLPWLLLRCLQCSSPVTFVNGADVNTVVAGWPWNLKKSYSVFWIFQHFLYFVAKGSHIKHLLCWFIVPMNRQKENSKPIILEIPPRVRPKDDAADETPTRLHGAALLPGWVPVASPSDSAGISFSDFHPVGTQPCHLQSHASPGSAAR